jgi:hypothetical protein
MWMRRLTSGINANCCHLYTRHSELHQLNCVSSAKAIPELKFMKRSRTDTLVRGERQEEEQRQGALVVIIISVLFCRQVELNAAGPFFREGNLVRDRAAALRRLDSYSDKDFKRRFRMKRWQFEYICDIIRNEIEPDTAGKLQAIRSSGSFVCVELRLAAALRILAGGSYLDAGDLFAISTSSIWESTVWPVVKAICSSTDEALDNIHFPFDDEAGLRMHEATFKKTAGVHWSGPGTVAAGDGCAVGIEQPSDAQVGGDVHSHHTRKYQWAFGFILFCDAKCNIMSVEATHVASAHDAEMYMAGSVHDAIHNAKLPPWAHVVLDSAFACTEQELTPWSRGRNPLSKAKDTFNYHLSAQRQCVERTFGILQARWGILWRPVKADFDNVKYLLKVLCRLHNYIMRDEDMAKKMHLSQFAHDEDVTWKRGDSSGHLTMVLVDMARGHPMVQGTRADTESKRRTEITRVLSANCAERPIHSAAQQELRFLRETAAYLCV